MLLCPNYRYVRRLPAHDGERRFAMGARRGPIPVRWEATQLLIPLSVAIEFMQHWWRARGCGVAWRVVRRGRNGREHEHRRDLGWPFIGDRRRAPRHRTTVHRGHRRPDACDDTRSWDEEVDRRPARRVVITGSGRSPRSAMAPTACGRASSPTVSVGPIDRFDPSPFPSRIAAQIDSFDPADHSMRPREAPLTVQRAIGRRVSHGVRRCRARPRGGWCADRGLDRLVRSRRP